MRIFRPIFFILISVVLLLFQSCDGCSPSGRQSHRKQIQYSNEIPENKVSRKAIEPKSAREPKSKNLADLYEFYKSSVFMVYTSDGDNAYQGSGFFISGDGLALSNYHVFEGTAQGLEIIQTIDRKKFKVLTIIEKSKDLDYILFRVDVGSYLVKNPIPIENRNPTIGEDVFAIGNPRGLESTLSKGIVSALREDNTLIQTTAEITYGSSGGPLINMDGYAIGITTAGIGEANLNFTINLQKLKLGRYVSDFLKVTKVVDGDTFWVDDGSRKGLKIRLIGVNTPETVHPQKPVEFYGKEASNYVKGLLEGSKVRLEFDVSKKDRYGRTLAYVYLEDGRFLNADLIKKGYGQAMTVPPNVKFSDSFLELERKAREEKIGLWAESN